MIQVSVSCVVCALQGGLRMVSRPFSPDVQVTPIQVWPALSHDLRTRVIGLLAQLALNVVAAHPENKYTGKEGSHADTTSTPKNPS
ncbi:MAG TPA: hypothetical protein DEV72_23715 [Ktedonobacter sp.]|jgi:hypothetical protein|nr:hypothetical protein [Ktedonobacter sp.]